MTPHDLTMDSGTSLESARIAALHRYEILDTPPDSSFDHITRLACRLLNVPAALITLVDSERVWIKSQYGSNLEQFDRRQSFCNLVVESGEPLIVEDASAQPCTKQNRLIMDHKPARFYAGVPLRIREGYTLGTLCVFDPEPRQLSAHQREALKSLGEIVVDQLELRLAARTASSRQNELLGMVAHELKNPLTTIPVYADLICDQVTDNQSLTQMCQHIRRASERMNLLINDILETVRLQTQEVFLKREPVDLAVLIGRLASINIVLANRKNQKVLLDVSETVIVSGDETRLSEIIDNLVSNAIKYSPPGSEITVRLGLDQETAILQVIDQGPGFTRQDLSQLFQPFTRLSARPTGGENSTGIGLSIVKSLVEAHGGRVFAENNAGRSGARLVVELPAIFDSGLNNN